MTIIDFDERYYDPSCLLVGLFAGSFVSSLTFLGPNVSKTVGDKVHRLGCKGPSIGNGIWRIE